MKKIILPVNVPTRFLSLVPEEWSIGQFSAALNHDIFGRGIFVHIDISVYTLTQESIDSMPRLQLTKNEEALPEVKRLVHITKNRVCTSTPESKTDSHNDLDFDTFLATILSYESFAALRALDNSVLREEGVKFEVAWKTASGKKCSILFRQSNSYSTGEIFFNDENHIPSIDNPFGNLFKPVLSGNQLGGYGQYYGTIL